MLSRNFTHIEDGKEYPFTADRIYNSFDVSVWDVDYIDLPIGLGVIIELKMLGVKNRFFRNGIEIKVV